MQRDDGVAVAGGEAQGMVACMLNNGDLGWKVHGLNYGEGGACLRRQAFSISTAP